METYTRHLLPTHCSMNPARPEDAEYYDLGQVAMILQKPGRTRPTRVATSFGAAETLGSQLECYHDQTGAYLGRYTVVGFHVFETGERAGIVPDRKFNHSVYK